MRIWKLIQTDKLPVYKTKRVDVDKWIKQHPEEIVTVTVVDAETELAKLVDEIDTLEYEIKSLTMTIDAYRNKQK